MQERTESLEVHSLMLAALKQDRLLMTITTSSGIQSCVVVIGDGRQLNASGIGELLS